MNIEQEARIISGSIIEWCFSEEKEGEDENAPSHLVESLLKRQKEKLINKACEWIKEHLPYGGDYLEDNILEGMTIDNIAKKLKQAMEEES